MYKLFSLCNPNTSSLSHTLKANVIYKFFIYINICINICIHNIDVCIYNVYHTFKVFINNVLYVYCLYIKLYFFFFPGLSYAELRQVRKQWRDMMEYHTFWHLRQKRAVGTERKLGGQRTTKKLFCGYV